jgi:DNA segregation ATPase FtsK/SpoIIIE, S-DNA-T family
MVRESNELGNVVRLPVRATSGHGDDSLPVERPHAEVQSPRTSDVVSHDDGVVDGQVVPERSNSRIWGAARQFVHSVRLDRRGDSAAYNARALPKPLRLVARTVYTTGHGHVSWVQRAVDAVSDGHIREQMRLARLTGDKVALAEWSDRHMKKKAHRREFIHNLPRTVIAILTTIALGFSVVFLLLVAVGLWEALTPGGMRWTDWWSAIGGILTGVLTVCGVLFWVVVFGTIPMVFLLAYREGRRVANLPRWMVSADEQAQMDSTISPDLIVAALRHMKIPSMAKYLDNGGTLEFIVPPREQGGGTYTQVRLPLGTAAVELLTSIKVELLAGNLGRHRHEVWPQREKETDARVLDLWIADKGTMDKPAPAWPLLHDGSFDVFRDRVPWGVTMRSEQVAVGMLQKHWLIGGNSNEGKTATLRLLALALALDVTVELHIADLKGDGDWRMFADRAATLIEGSSSQRCEETVTMLEWAADEVRRRYDRKADAGLVGAIPRELSRQEGSGFHPIWVFVDEVQIMYAEPHPIGGTKDDARAVKAAKFLHDQARAVNVHLMQGTQRPDDRTLPARVREGAHVRGSLFVSKLETAKMIMGDAADRGARPQDLRSGADAGTVVVTGPVEDIPKGQAFIIVRTHYVNTKDAYGVIERAMLLLRQSGRSVGPVLDADTDEPPDHLMNIAKVMDGTARMNTHGVLKRLAELDRLEYESWTFADLKEAMEAEGVVAKKSHGIMTVIATDIADALAHRASDGSEPA